MPLPIKPSSPLVLKNLRTTRFIIKVFTSIPHPTSIMTYTVLNFKSEIRLSGCAYWLFDGTLCVSKRLYGAGCEICQNVDFASI